MNSFSGVAMAGAAVFLGVSAVAFGATVVDAVRMKDAPLPEMALEPEVVADPADEGKPAPGPRGVAYPLTTDEEILDAVNQDLFQPDRTPPMERYVLPSERPSEEPSRNSRRQPSPDLQIVGTAIAGDLALAMVQPEDSLPFAVLQGESVNGFLVAAISEEVVTLTMGDWEFFLPVMEASRPSSSRNERGNDRERGNERAISEEAARALTERIRQMQQAVQGGGRGQMMRGGGGSLSLSPELRLLPAPRLVPPADNRGGGSGGHDHDLGGAS